MKNMADVYGAKEFWDQGSKEENIALLYNNEWDRRYRDEGMGIFR